MKKLRICALLLVIILMASCLSLVGCDNGKRKIPGWDETKQNVVFYTWGSLEEVAILQEIIDDFSNVEGNENINVIISKAGNDYYGDLELRLAGTQSPDIVQMKPGNVQPYLRSGAIISLQDYLDNSTLINQDTMLWEFNDGYRYNPTTKVQGNHQDDVYCLIKDFSPDFVMNYNKVLITDSMAALSYPKIENTNYPSQDEPMTYSQFIDFAQAMQTSDGSTMGTALDNEPFQQLLEWIQQSGGSLYSNDDKTVVDIKNTPAVRQAFDYYRMLRDRCSNSPAFNPTDSTFTMGRTTVALTGAVSPQIGPGQLKQRQAATIFYGRWAHSTYNMNQNPASCSVGFAPPAVPNNLEITSNTKYAGITAMVGLAISAKSTQKDAAFKFIEYYFTAGMEKLAKIGFNIPGNKSVAETTFISDPSLSAEDAEINNFFYELALNHTFVIKYNRYMSQSVVEDSVLSPILSQYFADSKGKAFSLTLWESTLDKITQKLQEQLDKYVE